MYIKTIFTTVISCDIYSLDIHFLLKTKQSQKLHYCSKLESDGFHSSNLAIALLIGICMYIFSLLHLMMTVLDALPSLHDISILHNNRLNDSEKEAMLLDCVRNTNTYKGIFSLNIPYQ